MSINYLLTTWNHTPDLSPADTLLLMVLADQAGDEERECFMKQATIARKAKRSERGVRDGLTKLEKAGYIEITNRAGRSSIFRLLYDHDGKRFSAEEWEAKATPAKSATPTPAKSADTPANPATPPAKLCRHIQLVLLFLFSIKERFKKERGQRPPHHADQHPGESSANRRFAAA